MLLLVVVSSAACQKSFARLAPSFTKQPTSNSAAATAPPAKIVDKEYEEYRLQVLDRFVKQDYGWIDQEAHRLRLSKDRLPGGYWKLRALYAGVEEPSLGDKASDGDWEDLLQGLAGWVKSKPDSVTARVSLASAWRGYASKARGSGYSDTVSRAAWDVYGKRLENAEQAIADAAQMKEQCPYWFVIALQVGYGQQRDRESLEKIFEAGTTLEPTFYYLHQVKAIHLLPRWGGQEGDWERFADESALKIGGHQGDIVFFGIFSSMYATDPMLMNTHQKWVPKLLDGFRSIEKLYGPSRHRLNEAAYFSVFGNDLQAKRELFARVGDEPDETVWRSKRNFEIYRQGVERQVKAVAAQAQQQTQQKN